MIPEMQDSVLGAFLLFCRISSCLMVAPGISSQVIPGRVKLLISLAVTLALFPLLSTNLLRAVSNASLTDLLRLIVSETCVGLLIGTCGRIFFLALEFAGTAIATYISFSVMPGVALDDVEQASSLSAIINMTALLLVFTADLHVELIKALLQSYTIIGIKFEAISPDAALDQILRVLLVTFDLALRLMSPFILYSIVVNLMFGVANKLLPQIPVYFISAPFIISGGLVLCALVIPDGVAMFIGAYKSWLISGDL